MKIFTEKWIFKNPPRMSLFFLAVMIIICVTEDIMDYKIGPIVASVFWISVGVNIGVNWGIKAIRIFQIKEGNGAKKQEN